MGDEHLLDRQVEQRPQRLAQVGVRPLAEPALGAEAQRVVGGARLRAGTEQDVADDDGALLRQPVDRLRRPGGREGADPAREAVAASAASTPRFASGRSERDGAHVRAFRPAAPRACQ